MSIWCIIIATGCYLLTALSNFLNKNYALAGVWACYAGANIGLLIVELQGGKNGP